MHGGVFITAVDDLVDTTSLVIDTDDEVITTIRTAIRLRSVSDHLLAATAAHCERLGTARRCGMRTAELLTRNGCAPTVAARAMRVGRGIDVLDMTARYSRDALLSGEHVAAVVSGVGHAATRCRAPIGSDLITDLDAVSRPLPDGTPDPRTATHRRADACDVEWVEQRRRLGGAFCCPVDGDFPPSRRTTRTGHARDWAHTHGLAQPTARLTPYRGRLGRSALRAFDPPDTNGCVLCRACHTDVHHRGWDVIMGHDRHPWLRPPASIDPHQTLMPSYHRRTMNLTSIAA